MGADDAERIEEAWLEASERLHVEVETGYVLDRDLELGRRELPRVFDGALGRHLHRRTADVDRARTRAAEAIAAIGVAEHDAHALDSHAEGIDDELRKLLEGGFGDAPREG